jgi:xylan 1,4-beta-xylosidase
MKALCAALLLLTFTATCGSQQTPERVNIHVAANEMEDTPFRGWNFFGYDEPNYTYAPNGKKLLSELASLSQRPVYIRIHNLFTSGDGSASLKWGSTNVYTENEAGKPIYSWEIVDRIFDTFRQAGIKPLVELGFMPEALSTHPIPYRHNFPQEPGELFTGWSYPPKDYGKWSQLVYQFVRHVRQRYGDDELKSWLWEVWNEPDIGYWHGTPQEFLKLYDYSVEAVLRAFPQARIGGPDTTGPASDRAAEFLRMFLEHCAHEKNFATGATGSRLDFISFHPKGAPKFVGDHVQMGLAHQLVSIQRGFKIVKSFPEWSKAQVVLGESDPEGCAACSAQKNPQNAYRNGRLYACYEAEALTDTLALASEEHIDLLGIVTWAFEFEGQPYFEGFRSLATNGIEKPVLNAFRMFGLMSEERVRVTSSAALAVDDIVRTGIRGKAHVNGIATRTERQLSILIWNYHDDDLPAPNSDVMLSVSGFPSGISRAVVKHFRIDFSHSNAYTVWKELGSPQSPSAEQYQQLEAAGQLQLLDSPLWTRVENATARIEFPLPRQGLSLLQISW